MISTNRLFFYEKNVITKKRSYLFIETKNRKICVLNHSQSFREHPVKISVPYYKYGGDWDFRISDLVKNPDGTDI